ncbi:MAG: hypothetical protein ACFFD9_09845 [Candidatus Thorarchaeota archaeon]
MEIGFHEWRFLVTDSESSPPTYGYTFHDFQSRTTGVTDRRGKTALIDVGCDWLASTLDSSSWYQSVSKKDGCV